MIAQKRLAALVKSGNIPSLLLFSGPEEAPLKESALDFTSQLIGPLKKNGDPDLHIYHPEGKTGMHAISAMRSLADEVSLPPLQSAYKVFIIHDADRMLESSHNALLKTFEEPTPATVFILLTHHPDKIPITIHSRAQLFSFGAPKRSEDSPFQLRLQELLSAGMTKDALDAFTTSIEEEKKSWEKELKKTDSEAGPKQKELLQREMEGAIACRFQALTTSLLVTLIDWYRDVELLHLNLDQHIHRSREALSKTPYIPFAKVEKLLHKTRTGLDRSIKLETCFESLFMALQLL